MILCTLDRFADTATLRYLAYRLSLLGLYHRAISNTAALNGVAHGHFKLELASLAGAFSEFESAAIVNNSIDLVARALSDVVSDTNKPISRRINDTITRSVDDTVSDVVALFCGQTLKDARHITKRLRHVSIQVDMLESQRGWSSAASLIAVKESISNVIPGFEFNDNRGRRWKSDRYIQTLLRGHYRNLYNETYLYALSKLGFTTAWMVSDHNHKPDVEFTIVATDAVSGLPSYHALIDARVMHPNTSYRVTKNQSVLTKL